VKTLQKRPINDHDSPSLEVAYMLEICGKICHICSIYAPHISPNSAYFPVYFASKSFPYFKKIFCYKPASQQTSRFLDLNWPVKL